MTHKIPVQFTIRPYRGRVKKEIRSLDIEASSALEAARIARNQAVLLIGTRIANIRRQVFTVASVEVRMDLFEEPRPTGQATQPDVKPGDLFYNPVSGYCFRVMRVRNDKPKAVCRAFLVDGRKSYSGADLHVYRDILISDYKRVRAIRIELEDGTTV